MTNRKALAAKLLKAAKLLLQARWSRDFETFDQGTTDEDAPDPGGKLFLDIPPGEAVRLEQTKSKSFPQPTVDNNPSPTWRRVDIPDSLRTKPEQIDIIKEK